MKKEFAALPESMKARNMYGFDWKEFVLAIPSPLVTVTTWKPGGKTNATMQSWLTFTGDETGFYCIFGSVNRAKHMYRTLKERGACVINFPTAENYMKCYATIWHNRDEDDEIAAAGLTAEPATMVDAPRIRECFLNLECEYQWERELAPGSGQAVMCVKVVNVVMDERHFDNHQLGRYGDTGYLYNVHAPTNPITGEESDICIAGLKLLKTQREMEEE